MQHHFAFTHLKPENFTKSSNNDDTNKYCLNHTSQFFALGKLKIFLMKQFMYFWIEFVNLELWFHNKNNQLLIIWMRMAIKSNFKSLTRRIQFYSAAQCCLGQYNGDLRDLIVHLVTTQSQFQHNSKQFNTNIG